MLHGRVAYHELEGVTVDLGERERIVRAHGGDIRVHSDSGRTRFDVLLPRAPDSN